MNLEDTIKHNKSLFMVIAILLIITYALKSVYIGYYFQSLTFSTIPETINDQEAGILRFRGVITEQDNLFNDNTTLYFTDYTASKLPIHYTASINCKPAIDSYIDFAGSYIHNPLMDTHAITIIWINEGCEE